MAVIRFASFLSFYQFLDFLPLKTGIHSCNFLQSKFHCETCGKEFEEKGKLKTHYQVHSVGLSSRKSLFCRLNASKVFSLPFSLQNERFHCDMCESSFQHKRGLDRHQACQHLGKGGNSFGAFHSAKSLEAKSLMHHLFPMPGTQRKTPKRRSLARSKVKEEPDVKVSQPNDSGGLDSSTYSLRTRSE